jgi:ATP-dependent DNA helicase RecQ
MAGNVRGTGVSNWRLGYEAQVAFRQGQIDRMMEFAESRQCRMTAIIQHFGDTADATRACGICDVCNPKAATAQSFHPPDAEEFRQLAAVLRALGGQSRSTGKLHTELATGPLRGTAAAKDRKAFDVLLDALARAALITLIADTFTNPEGNVITYRKAALTHEGREAAASESLHPYDLLLKDVAESPSPSSTSKSGRTSAPRPSKASLKAERDQTTALYTPSQRDLEARMRAWRKTEAAKTGKPAFIVLSDTVIRNVVIAWPHSIPELLTVSGIGPDKADRFGAEIIALCRAASSNESAPQPPPKNSSFRPERSEVEEPPHSFSSAASPERTGVDDREVRQPSIPFHRTRPIASDPTADLTADQQLLDLHLRAWRKAESERIGLPQFFVLGSSALRSIVLLRPKTITQLQTIAGIGPDKSEKFGASIITICNQ